jgi:anti-sigma factor RsiW
MSTDIHSLLGAYVLDAVDDLERAAFERHLRDCDDCRTETDEMRAAAARLADPTWSVPPPRMRENVLATIASTRQLPPSQPAVRPRPSASAWRRWTAAAAVVVAVGASVGVVQEQRVRREHAAAEQARAAEARIQAVLTAPDLTLREQVLSSGGKVTVATSALHGAGVIMLAASAPPAGGRVYQLWTLRAGVPVNAGVLEPGQSVSVRIVDSLEGVSDVGVTVEPPHGSVRPTTKMIADLKLT